jgi:hypothetical protein
VTLTESSAPAEKVGKAAVKKSYQELFKGCEPGARSQTHLCSGDARAAAKPATPAKPAAATPATPADQPAVPAAHAAPGAPTTPAK